MFGDSGGGTQTKTATPVTIAQPTSVQQVAAAAGSAVANRSRITSATPAASSGSTLSTRSWRSAGGGSSNPPLTGRRTLLGGLG